MENKPVATSGQDRKYDLAAKSPALEQNCQGSNPGPRHYCLRNFYDLPVLQFYHL